MYFIVNNTKGEIAISDLNISLGPRKSMDLDRVRKRSDIVNSKDLKTCVKKGFIKVRQVTPMGGETVQVEAKASVDDAELAKIRKAVQEELKAQNQQNTNEDLTSAVNQLKSMIEGGLIGGASQVVHHHHGPGASPQAQDDETELDEDTLTQIHMKSQNKIAKDAEGNVILDEHKSKDNLSSNIDELDDLLE